MRRCERWLAAGVAWFVWASPVAAAQPELKYLTPPGAQRGAAVEITAVGKFDKWPVQAWVSGEGVRIEPTKEKGKFSVVVVENAAPGPRWVRLLNDEGASSARPFIVGGLRETAERETNDDNAQAQDVGSEPTTVNGILAKAGDVDTYRVSLARGQTFVASVDANERLGSPIDIVLQIVQDRFVLAQNHDERGLDPQLVFFVPRDGEYFVRVFGFASDPNSSIKYHGSADSLYRLTLTTGPFVEQAFPAAVTVTAQGSPALGGVNLPAGQSTAVIAQQQAGLYAPPLPVGFGGDAQIAVVEHPTASEHEPNDRKSPQKFTPPQVISGRIDAPGDRDVYAFTAKKGQTWRIRVRSDSLGFAVDPLLMVESADGKSLLRIDDAGRGDPDAEAVLKVTADGDYQIVVEDLFGNGGPRYAYLLDVRAPDADFAMSVAAGEFTVAAGKPLEIPVTIERPAGMTSDIELRIEGLPKGSDEVKGVSSGKGETAKKVTLKMTLAAAFSGPIRIVGEAKTPAALKRTATATIPNIPRGRIADLWLTTTSGKK